MFDFFAGLTEENTLVHPKHVAGGKNHTEGGENGPRHIGLRCSLQDEKFSDEIVEGGQANAGQGGDEEHNGKPRGHSCHTAIVRDFQRVAAFIEEADQQEECTGRNAVVQHLIDGAIETHLREGENAQHHKAKVADRGIRHQLFHIGLDHGNQRTVNNTDNRQSCNPARILPRRCGEHGQTEADQSVGTHLQHDRSQHEGTSGGRFHVRIGQPGVQREQRHFNGEGEEEGEEEQRFLSVRQSEAATGELFQNDDVIEGASLGVKKNDGHQHQD